MNRDKLDCLEVLLVRKGTHVNHKGPTSDPGPPAGVPI